MIAGDKGQAAQCVQAERLTPVNLKRYVIVRTQSISLGEGINKTLRLLRVGQQSNRLIDATMSFYGLYVAINQQVENKNVACSKSALIEVEALT